MAVSHLFLFGEKKKVREKEKPKKIIGQLL